MALLRANAATQKGLRIRWKLADRYGYRIVRASYNGLVRHNLGSSVHFHLKVSGAQPFDFEWSMRISRYNSVPTRSSFAMPSGIVTNESSVRAVSRNVLHDLRCAFPIGRLQSRAFTIDSSALAADQWQGQNQRCQSECHLTVELSGSAAVA